MSRLTVVWHPGYEVDLGDHVYPTEKYRLVRERLGRDAPPDALRFVRPEPAPREDLARVHRGDYLDKLRTGTFSRREQRELEVPFSPELRRAMRIACGGTTRAARDALREGVAVHLGGGFHHAFPDHGEGFCLLNDTAVAIRALRAAGEIGRAAVVDTDVHQGNGTAEIFRDDAAVFTLSVHQDRLYPARKPPSDLDVGLADRTGDEEYLSRLETALPRALADPRPDLVVYLAGADPYREDQLGGLSLSRGGLRRRDRRVLASVRRRGIPAVVLLAGGYALRVADTVSIHENTVREALRVRRSSPGEPRAEAAGEAAPRDG